MKILYALAIAIALAGCSKNPLLNDDTVASIKQFVFTYPLEDKEFDTACQGYLKGHEANSHLKARCDKTVNFIYNKLKNADGFTHATEENLHDPKLWQRVFNTKS